MGIWCGVSVRGRSGNVCEVVVHDAPDRDCDWWSGCSTGLDASDTVEDLELETSVTGKLSPSSLSQLLAPMPIVESENVLAPAVLEKG